MFFFPLPQVEAIEMDATLADLAGRVLSYTDFFRPAKLLLEEVLWLAIEAFLDLDLALLRLLDDLELSSDGVFSCLIDFFMSLLAMVLDCSRFSNVNRSAETKFFSFGKINRLSSFSSLNSSTTGFCSASELGSGSCLLYLFLSCKSSYICYCVVFLI